MEEFSPKNVVGIISNIHVENAFCGRTQELYRVNSLFDCGEVSIEWDFI